MKISIITVNLNKGDVIERTLKSVLHQTYTNIEYIVIDGGSTDNSVEIIKNLGSKIHYWISEPDHGIYNAMNKGLERASGNFLLFLNSGDYLAKNDVIKKFVGKLEMFKNNIQNTIFYGNIVVEDKIINAPPKINLNVLSSSSLPHPATFIPKNIFDKIGYYNEGYNIISDWIFFLEAYLNQFKFIYINCPITIFELNGMSSNFNQIEKEKNSFLHNTYPNLVDDFKIFSSLKNYELSRIHQFIEKLKNIIKF